MVVGLHFKRILIKTAFINNSEWTESNSARHTSNNVDVMQKTVLLHFHSR